jgi:plastocyanin
MNMRRKRYPWLVLVVAGCGAGYTSPTGSGGSEAGPAAGPMVEVAATDGFQFDPPHLTVAAGTTVRWTNKGAVPHTVTSGASSRPADDPGALFDSRLPAGAVVDVTLTTPGDYPYFCRYHEGMGMAGVVTVTARDGAMEPNASAPRSRPQRAADATGRPILEQLRR